MLEPLPGSPNPYESLRVLVVRENWLGNTGLSAFTALLRAGIWADSISERDYVPIEWKRLSMKVFGRLLRAPAVDEFNRDLLRMAKELKPDVLLAVKGTFIQAETLRATRQMGITCYCFYPDVTFTADGRYLPRAISEYDWVFTTKSFGLADLETLGQKNSSFLPHAFDPMVHRPRQPTPQLMKELGCDVSFIGKWSPKKQHLLEELVELRPQLNLKVWGNRWQQLPSNSPLRARTMFKAINGIGYASAISCSKINLGLLFEGPPGASSGDLITSRTFHIPASGGLLLHERTPDLLEIFKEGESCMCFDGVKELALKVDQLLADEALRTRVAVRGREVAEASHSWDHRVRTILDHYLAKHRSTADSSETMQ
jgi:spore maturation protein CgeB